MYLSHGLGAATTGVAALIQSLAPSYGVPPNLALAVAQHESGLDQNAHGAAGEIGVFQLMPGTASSLGVNPSDLDQNVRGGLSYLSQMFQRFGNWTDALVAYNAGPGRVSNPPASSQSYASSILAASGFDSSSVSDTLYSPAETSYSFAGTNLDLSAVFDTGGGLSLLSWAALALAGVGLAVWVAS